MITMRQDGYLKALAGQTTISEVNRVTPLIWLKGLLKKEYG